VSTHCWSARRESTTTSIWWFAFGDVARIQDALRPLGFALHEEHLPVRFVLRRNGEQLDFHTVTFESVPCISARVQVLCHLGDTPTAKDARDVLELCRAFGLSVPEAYEGFLGRDEA
jgi:hypothetical protein